jgi:hypothetical protein
MRKRPVRTDSEQEEGREATSTEIIFVFIETGSGFVLLRFKCEFPYFRNRLFLTETTEHCKK